MDNQQNKLVLFQSKKIRRIWHNDEWFYSVVDIIEALTDSPTPRQYWEKVKQREFIEIQLSPIWGQLKLVAADGKERLDEIENPELGQERMKVIYEQKGYSKDWIDKRLRGIAIRQNLTDEISKATFGMTPSEYKRYKNIPDKTKANLRDNMTDLELIFTMLGEKMTTEISNKEKPKAMIEHKKVARRGGGVAGNARKQAEKELGRSVISKGNYLLGDTRKRLKKLNNN